MISFNLPPRVSLVGIVPVAMVLLGTSVRAADVYVGKKTTGSVAMESIDHSVWSKLLTKYVDANGRVDYTGWHKNRTDRKALDHYLNQLSTAKRKGSSRNGRFAFWINAYNAVTMKGILDVYPTTSIRNHTAKLFGFNIWKDLLLYVDGRAYSLDDIEHQILRPMKEPRIHFAIVCASIGCPRLLNTAYVPEKVSQQLAANTTDFFSRSQNLQFDAGQKRLKLSSLLSWFQEDFGASEQAMLKRITGWIPNVAARKAIASGGVSVEYIDYDWNLNDQKTIPKR